MLLLGLVAMPAVAAEQTTMRAEVFGPLGLHVLTMRTKIEETGESLWHQHRLPEQPRTEYRRKISSLACCDWRQVPVAQCSQTPRAARVRAICGRANRVLAREPDQELVDILRRRIVEHFYEVAYRTDRVPLHNAGLNTAVSFFSNGPSVERRECLVESLCSVPGDGVFGRHLDLNPSGWQICDRTDRRARADLLAARPMILRGWFSGDIKEQPTRQTGVCELLKLRDCLSSTCQQSCYPEPRRSICNARAPQQIQPRIRQHMHGLL